MSRDELHEIANREVPIGIHVPNSWPALITWAVGRFGMWVVLAVIACFWAYRMYEDMNIRQDKQDRTNERVLLAFERQAAVASEQTQAIKELAKAVESNTREINTLSRKP